MHADAAIHIRGGGDWVLLRDYNLTQAVKGDVRWGHARKGITVTEEGVGGGDGGDGASGHGDTRDRFDIGRVEVRDNTQCSRVVSNTVLPVAH